MIKQTQTILTPSGEEIVALSHAEGASNLMLRVFDRGERAIPINRQEVYTLIMWLEEVHNALPAQE